MAPNLSGGNEQLGKKLELKLRILDSTEVPLVELCGIEIVTYGIVRETNGKRGIFGTEL